MARVTTEHKQELQTQNDDSAEPLSKLRPDLDARLAADIQAAGGALPVDPALAGSLGVTMFDLPGSEDHTVTVLLGKDRIARAASQALVRIKSRDGRAYLGIVTAGPFAEPD